MLKKKVKWKYGRYEKETELLKVKIRMCETKNIPDGINGLVDSEEEKISKLEGIAIEIIQKEIHREKE